MAPGVIKIEVPFCSFWGGLKPNNLDHLLVRFREELMHGDLVLV